MFEDTEPDASSDRSTLGRKTALVTGSVALGALVTGSLYRRINRLKLSSPQDLEPALDADVKTMEIMEGRTSFYMREGKGPPIVLLHSINAAASTYEMKPIFEHFAAHTERPIYALEWFGFGLSERPPVRYAAAIYERQLRRFLSEQVHQPADLIALSLSGEYAAQIARSFPYLVRRMVLIAPTGMSSDRSSPVWKRAAIAAADSIGAFEILFYKLTRSNVLRRFYQRQVFQSGDVPEPLVDYAVKTTSVQGAHHAPRYFVQGLLSSGSAAAHAYAALRVPTLIVVPETAEGLVQQFDRLDEMALRNGDHLSIQRISGGLLPQWENPEPFFEAVDAFIGLR